MADQPANQKPNERLATANYVATLSGDLATLARHHGMATLGYLLEMAKLEAENVVRHTSGGPNATNENATQ
jgi:hypothetical protein